MSRELIITMSAANRAGILAAVTKAMEELAGDLREASQTVVRGFFIMIFSAEFPEKMEQAIIRDHLQDACRPFGIQLDIREAPENSSSSNAASNRHKQYRLRLGGRNQPGALRRMSQVMSLKNIDITGMHAVRTEEGRAFEMVLKLAVPADCPVNDLLRDLEQTGQEFAITMDMREFGE